MVNSSFSFLFTEISILNILFFLELENKYHAFGISIEANLIETTFLISDGNINNILDGSDTDISKNFNINDLNKNSVFNKLSNEQKTLVINRILEKTPHKQKQQKSNEHTRKKSYFYCKSCGYNEKIPNKKFIFSRGNENKNEIVNYNFMNYVNDNTLPRTKNYNCINQNCSTHINPEIKMAVFYRHKGSYNIRYICKICDKYWNIYNDTNN